jgi:hypothetical protein
MSNNVSPKLKKMRNFVSFVIALLIGIPLSAQTTANLRLNLVKGKTYKVKVITRQITKSLEDHKDQLKGVTFQYFISLTPLTIDEDGTTAKVKFDSISNVFSSPSMVLSSNLQNNSLKISDPATILSIILKRLTQSDLIVILEPTGNVKEITNLKQVTQCILTGIDSIQSDAALVLKAQAKSFISESAIKQMINPITAFLPGVEISVGTKWDATLTMVTHGVMVLDSIKYKFEKIDGKKGVITSESKIKPASLEPITKNGVRLVYDVNGLGKSTVLFDLKTGWQLESVSRQYLEGFINVTFQGQVTQVPTEMSGTTEIISYP